MTAIFNYFFKNRYALEIASVITFSVIISLLNFFLLLYSATQYLHAEKQNEKALLLTLKDRQLHILENDRIKKSLLEVKQSNPDLYQTVNTAQNNDAILEKLTTLVEHAGFKITHIQPFFQKNKDAAQHDFMIQMSMIGSYLSLFTLIDLLNENAWPLKMSGVHIDNINHLILLFALRAPNA